MKEKGFLYTIFLMSEISPVRIALFEDFVDAWIQIACPQLSIDWGDAFWETSAQSLRGRDHIGGDTWLVGEEEKCVGGKGGKRL
ncbi:hypothetical protein S245_005290 [Arachis hypogaea]